MKVNGGELKGLEGEVCVDWVNLEHGSEFQYLGFVLVESGTDEADCRRKVGSGKRDCRCYYVSD